MPERYGVGPDPELRTPFFGNHLGETGDTSFCKAVVRLPSVAMYTGCAADVDDTAGRAVFDAEVGGGGADESERRGIVDGKDGVPLLVGHLDRETLDVSDGTAPPSATSSGHDDG